MRKGKRGALTTNRKFSKPHSIKTTQFCVDSPTKDDKRCPSLCDTKVCVEPDRNISIASNNLGGSSTGLLQAEVSFNPELNIFLYKTEIESLPSLTPPVEVEDTDRIGKWQSSS